MKKFSPVMIALLAFASSSFAQDRPSLGLGVGGGVYLPTNAKTKRLLGNTWLSFAVTPTRLASKNGFSVDSDLNFVGRDKNGNRLFMAFYTVGVSTPLGGSNPGVKQAFKPYAALRVGPAYLDYKITDGGVTRKKNRLGWNGNVELGADLSDNVRVSFRYDTISKFDGFNFDGFSAHVIFKLGRL